MRPVHILGFLSLVFLLLPHLIFGAGWLNPGVGAVYAAVIAAILWRPGRLALEEWRAERDRRFGRTVWWIPAICLTIMWVSLSGAGGAGYQNGDYVASNSLLKDLINRSWPLEYDIPAGPGDSRSSHLYLVYYFAYYLPAAVVGKALGCEAANVAVFAWTCLGVLLALSWAALIARVPRTIESGVTLIAIYMLFSGMDWLGTLYVAGHAPHPVVGVSHFRYSAPVLLQYDTALLGSAACAGAVDRDRGARGDFHRHQRVRPLRLPAAGGVPAVVAFLHGRLDASGNHRRVAGLASRPTRSYALTRAADRPLLDRRGLRTVLPVEQIRVPQGLHIREQSGLYRRKTGRLLDP
jgi:hypothetical protein